MMRLLLIAAVLAGAYYYASPGNGFGRGFQISAPKMPAGGGSPALGIGKTAVGVVGKVGN